VNELLLSLDASGWKPLFAALLLPPLPLILLVLLGSWWLYRRRPVGWLLVLPACFALWLCGTVAFGDALARLLVRPPAPLDAEAVATLKQAGAAQPGSVAIVVLGGGRETLAPEYGMSNLSPVSLTRLRYGLWLHRATGLPVAFSGGIGHAAAGVAPEAEVAARVAAQEFGRTLKWIEPQSRDTRENAAYTVGLLRGAGVRKIVLVTDGWHMQRARRAFEEDVARTGGGIEIVAAPMGLGAQIDNPGLRWLPSSPGLTRVREVLREWIGLHAGA
jgi:uncharacterized SAM-binding protein YcdF (DUF218 family)